MEHITFTIMTPTYNRAGLLERLYKSILEQGRKDLEWLIVDDGSTDDTEQIIKKIIGENKINIRYIYQDNGGKYKAFNNGIENAEGDVFFCVDSDDLLAGDALNILETRMNSTKKDKIAGFVSLKSDFNGNILSDDLPDNKSIHLYELTNKIKINGEFCIVYFTSVLKNYRFPDVYPEKFVGESVLYDAIDKKFKIQTINKVMNICEYQNDGLSNQFVANMLNNPTGYKIYYAQRIDMAYTWKARIGYIVRYNVFSQLSPDKNNKYTGKYSLLVKLLWFTGILGRLYYRRLGRNEKA